MNIGEQIIDNCIKAIKAQREVFWEKLRAGEQQVCPCCDRYAQIYRERIIAQQAYQLIKFYKAGAHIDWKHSSIIAGDMGPAAFGKLRHWGLIVRRANDEDPTKKYGGFYMITEKGVAFVEKNIKVPSHATVYNDTVLGYSDIYVDIVEALKTQFDYQKLMEGTL